MDPDDTIEVPDAPPTIPAPPPSGCVVDPSERHALADLIDLGVHGSEMLPEMALGYSLSWVCTGSPSDFDGFASEALDDEDD